MLWLVIFLIGLPRSFFLRSSSSYSATPEHKTERVLETIYTTCVESITQACMFLLTANVTSWIMDMADSRCCRDKSEHESVNAK